MLLKIHQLFLLPTESSSNFLAQPAHKALHCMPAYPVQSSLLSSPSHAYTLTFHTNYMCFLLSLHALLVSFCLWYPVSHCLPSGWLDFTYISSTLGYLPWPLFLSSFLAEAICFWVVPRSSLCHISHCHSLLSALDWCSVVFCHFPLLLSPVHSPIPNHLVYLRLTWFQVWHFLLGLIL